MVKYRRSIFTKLLATYMVLIVSVLLIIALLLSLGYSNYVFRQKQNELHSAALQTAALVERYRNDQIPYSELNNSLDILSAMTGSRIYALRLSLESLEQRNLVLEQDLVEGYLIEDLKTILNGREVTRKKQYSDKFDTHVVFVGIPLKNQSGIEGAILLFAPLDTITANIARINLIIWLAAAVAILLSGIVIYAVSLKISRPLKMMEEGARRLAEGEQVEDLKVNSGDELEKLAQAFNYMKNKILAAEKMRREFIASVSHDLRTPLTTINGFVQGMLEGLVKQEDSPKYLRIIKEETQRLMGLTGDILEQAKLQSGGINLLRKYLNLKKLLEKVLEDTGILQNGKNVLVRLDCPENIEVYADEDRLKQIMVNILDNALKFSDANGKVLVQAVENEEAVTIKVRDNGQGIAPDDLPLIFEKFYRGDKSRQGPAGTGLGLNIVKMLVEAHGGKVQALSSLGEGTEILIIFPK